MSQYQRRGRLSGPAAIWFVTAVLLVTVLMISTARDPELSARRRFIPDQGDPSGAQPIDIIHIEEFELVRYARELFHSTCLAEAGYPQNLAAMEEYRPTANWLRFSPRDYLGFGSEQEARDTGFRPDIGPGRPRIVSFDPNYDAARRRCGEHHWGDPEAWVMLPYEYSFLTAFAEIRVDGRLGLPTLIDCLEEAGFGFQGSRKDVTLAELPERFVTLGQYDMPMVEWEPNPVPGAVLVSDPIPPRDWIPSAPEQELAAAVFRCDQESDRLDQLWDAHYAAQVAWIGHGAGIAGMNAQLDDLASRARVFIAERDGVIVANG
jgi:hypothetical protein